MKRALTIFLTFFFPQIFSRSLNSKPSKPEVRPLFPTETQLLVLNAVTLSSFPAIEMARKCSIFIVSIKAPDTGRVFLLRQELTTTAVGPKGVTQDLRRTPTIIILTVAKRNKTKIGLGFGLRSFPFFVANVHIRMYTYCKAVYIVFDNSYYVLRRKLQSKLFVGQFPKNGSDLLRETIIIAGDAATTRSFSPPSSCRSQLSNLLTYLPVLFARYSRLPQEVIRKYLLKVGKCNIACGNMRVCLQRLP
ncbi:hypothetical protein ALC62_10421 [Cyphomyrmex costatus]|uniref:Uncharacterized protein n=1 Tax=Cyphomyrmex costatus TaxID=456900 RepID=A0A151IDX3_9HYME|nr:hypothetical protein ALC62_10421 [Cyphomyrmex costatus]